MATEHPAPPIEVLRAAREWAEQHRHPQPDDRMLAIVYAAGRRQAAADIQQLIVDLTDEDPCRFDHHGYCQAHGWMATDPRCPHARAKELLAEGDAR